MNKKRNGKCLSIYIYVSSAIENNAQDYAKSIN